MSGQKAPAVLDTRAPFNCRFRKISHLSGNVSGNGYYPGWEQVHVDESREKEKPEDHRSDYGSSSAFPGFPGTHNWCQVMPAEVSAEIVAAGVANPIHRQPECQPIGTDRMQQEGRLA